MKVTRAQLNNIIREALTEVERIEHWDTKTGKPLTRKAVQAVLKDPKHRWHGWAKEQGGNVVEATPEIKHALTVKFYQAFQTLEAAYKELKGLGHAGEALAYDAEEPIQAIGRLVFQIKKQL